MKTPTRFVNAHMRVLLTVRVLIRQPVVFLVVVLKFAVHGAALLGPVVLVRVLTLMSITHPELVV